MVQSRLEIVVGTAATPALLAVLSVAVGLGPTGWIVGLVVAGAASTLHTVARWRASRSRIGPADWVTLARVVLTAGIAGLVAEAHSSGTVTHALVTLACVALALDAADGQVARRTGTVSALGARFDAETDAFLILVLSIEVSRDYGSWVLLIGAARYAFLVAGWVFRWLAAPLPSRRWGKVVAAVQGIVLTAAASGALSQLVGMSAVGIALLLLAQSFGHDAAWLYRQGAGPRTRTVVRRATTALAVLFAWAVLVAPDRLDRLTLATLARVPIEGVVLVVLCLLLPARPRIVLAYVAGTAFGLIAVLKVFDMAFNAQLDRPFNVITDWTNLVLGIGVVRDSVGTRITDELLVLATLGLVVMIAAAVTATVRVCASSAQHRRSSARAVTVLGLVWIVAAAGSLQLVPGAPVASLSTAGLAVSQVQAAATAIRGQEQFDATLHSSDPYARIPSTRLLSGLRGKDVVLVFVESYGQVAVHGTSFSPSVDASLRRDSATLTRSGFSSRSAFLSSPTFGGMSWLAHSTLQSGLWVNSQQRFDQLMTSNRLTLSSAFADAGWHTVSDNPADKHPWAQGVSFYHYQQLFGRYNIGYQGPRFSWAAMPDQYTFARFQQLELAGAHQPVMAEIDTVSSHTPWTPLPHMVPWDRVGNGSIFDHMPSQGLSPDVAWQNSATVRKLYGQSIQYSMNALTSWVARSHDKNLVVLLLGDHQPATTVSGYGATHDVPVTVLAHDPGVIRRIEPWKWQAGLIPDLSAPVWPMDAFRNRFLDTFSAAARPPAR